MPKLSSTYRSYSTAYSKAGGASVIGLDLFLAVVLGGYLGKKLDAYFHTTFFVVVWVILGCVAGLYSASKTIMKEKKRLAALSLKASERIEGGYR